MNLLFIVIDYLRADHLSCYGYNRKTSPQIDKFIQRGKLFGCHISNGAWTLPSVSSMFTGLLPSEHGAHWENNFLDTNNADTIAQALKKNGYETVAITTNPWISSSFGILDGFEHITEILHKSPTFLKHSPGKKLVDFLPNPRPREGKVDPAIEARRASKVIFEAKKALVNNSSKTNFLYLHFMDCHPNFIPPEDIRGSFENAPLIDDLIAFNEKIRAAKCSRYSEKAVPLSDFDIKKTRDLYDECILGLDQVLGNFFTWLEDNKVLNNTTVILLGDHGTCLGEHNIVGIEANLYNEVLHVPCAIVAPGVSAECINKITQSIDLRPTIEQLVGIKSEKTFRGQDILDSELPTHRPIISELFVRASHVKKHGKLLDRRIRSCQNGIVKVICSTDGEVETFATTDMLRERPTAKYNQNNLEKLCKENSTGFWNYKVPKSEAPPLDVNLLRQFRDLGYLD